MRTLVAVLVVAISCSAVYLTDAAATRHASRAPASHLSPISSVTPVVTSSRSGSVSIGSASGSTAGTPACVKGSNEAGCHEGWRSAQALSWRKPSSEKEAMRYLKNRIRDAVAPIDQFLKEVKKVSGTENEFKAARAAVTPMVSKLRTLQQHNEEELAADNERLLKDMEEQATAVAYKILLKRRDKELAQDETENLIAKAASAAAQHLRTMVIGNPTKFTSQAISALQKGADALVIASKDGIKQSAQSQSRSGSSSSSAGSRSAVEARFAQQVIQSLKGVSATSSLAKSLASSEWSSSSSGSRRGSESSSESSSGARVDPIAQLQAIVETKDDTLRAQLTKTLHATIAKPEHRSDRYTVQWVSQLLSGLEANMPGKKEEKALADQAAKIARLKLGAQLAKGAEGLFEGPESAVPADWPELNTYPAAQPAPGVDPMLAVLRDLSPRDESSAAVGSQLVALQTVALKKMLQHALQSSDPQAKKQALAAYLSFALANKGGKLASSSESSAAGDQRVQVLKEVVQLMQQAHQSSSAGSESSSTRSESSRSSESSAARSVSQSLVQSLSANLSSLSSILQKTTGSSGSLDVQSLSSLFTDFAMRNGFLPSETDVVKSESGALLRLAKPVASASLNNLPTDANAIASAVKDALSKAEPDIKQQESLAKQRLEAERKLAAEKEKEADRLTQRVAVEVKLLQSRLNKLQQERGRAESSSRSMESSLSRGDSDEASESQENSRQAEQSSRDLTSQIGQLQSKIQKDLDTIKTLRQERKEYETDAAQVLKSLSSTSLGQAKPEEIYLDMHKVLGKMDRMNPAHRAAVLARLIKMLRDLHSVDRSSASMHESSGASASAAKALKDTERKLQAELSSAMKKQLKASSASSSSAKQRSSGAKTGSSSLDSRTLRRIKLNEVRMERHTEAVHKVSTELKAARKRLQMDQEAGAKAGTTARRKVAQIRVAKGKEQIKKLVQKLQSLLGTLKTHVRKNAKLRGEATDDDIDSESSEESNSESSSALDSSIASAKAQLSQVQAAKSRALKELSSMSSQLGSSSKSFLELDSESRPTHSHGSDHAKITPTRHARAIERAARVLEKEPGLGAEFDSLSQAVERVSKDLSKSATDEYAELNRSIRKRVSASPRKPTSSSLLELESEVEPSNDLDASADQRLQELTRKYESA